MVKMNFYFRDKNLTLKYYAEKVLRFMQQSLLSKKVEWFMELPTDRQQLEIGKNPVHIHVYMCIYVLILTAIDFYFIFCCLEKDKKTTCINGSNLIFMVCLMDC